MSLESVFWASHAVAVTGWLALALAPLARDRLVLIARIVSALLCFAYLIEFFTITEIGGGDFTTLAGITELFAKPGNVMLGWTHYLAFDLFIGSWEAEDAGRRGVPHWLLLPALFLTYLLGPIGLLTYLLIRSIAPAMKRRPAS